MKAMRIAILAALALAGSAYAQQPLNDAELSEVNARDGISIAMHLVLNGPDASGAGTRLSWGTKVDGATNYLVFNNVHGTIDMFALSIDVHARPDGGDYVAIGLPVQTKFSNVGFDSMSVQADPAAPVTGDLGHININGTLSMQGEFRFWAH